MRHKTPVRRIRIAVYLLLLLCGLLTLHPAATLGQSDRGAILLLDLRGVINPPVANYLDRALTEAVASGAQLVVVQLDTPGGLDSSTRQMTQAMLASPVPVAVYVTPAGARAASAGLFLLTASHIAAMSPSTNTGSAHPVPLGGADMDETMAEKIVHDAAANIRGLATARGRNTAWVEEAVRESVSATADEALALGVIDLVARDLDHLLEQLHGRTVTTASGERTLDLTDAPRVPFPMTFAEQLLHVISSPDIAFILLSIGTIGLIAELYNPGTFVPGITGVIALIFAFFALGNLPTNWAGVALIALAIVLLGAELATDGFGVLGVGATVSFLLGGLLLFRPFTAVSPVLPELSVSPWVLGGTTGLMAAFIVLLVGSLARTRKTPLLTGPEQYAGHIALVYRDLAPRGRVRYDSQLWHAVVRPPQFIPAGEEVLIAGIEGLTLVVQPTPTTVTRPLPASPAASPSAPSSTGEQPQAG